MVKLNGTKVGDILQEKDLSSINLKILIEEETKKKFDKNNKICCPFHSEKTPSFSIRFNANTGKEQFKCFGCAAEGDAIDFIKKFKSMNYIEAKEYLGLSTEKTVAEQLEDKVKGYINWQIEKTDFRKGHKLLGLFQFVDNKNNTLYFKAKFFKPDGHKELSYYHVENDKVINKRGSDEVLYNLYNVVQAIKNDKIILLTEGEKDSNTLNYMLKNNGYVSTSIKGCKDISILEGSKIYVCGDTGKAGEEYKQYIYNQLFDRVKAFKFINLPGIENLGDNKDITDWIESGHTKKDLMNAFKRNLDLKNKNELQQDFGGIYKTVFKEKGDNVQEIKKYLTNFNVLEAISIDYMDKDTQGIKLICKSSMGKVFQKIKEVSVFDDVKSFRNFLGSMDLAYQGDLSDLIVLKKWINKYFIFNHIVLYDNPKFAVVDSELSLITNEGILFSNKIDTNGKSESNFKLDIIQTEPIKKNEIEELAKNLFCFSTLPRSYSIVGTIINNLAIVQAIKLKIKFHHLLIVGESGSGKTTIMTNVVAPILNYPISDIKAIGLITPFALIKELSNGNYSMLFDEFKPSSLDRYKIAKLSETLRNLYDRATVSRSDKTFSINNFQLARPIIVAGEESYPNKEKALIERSCIIYLSKFERTKEQTEAMEYLKKNESLLNKLGRSLVDIILKLKVEEYAALRNEVSKKIKNLKDRPLNTAVNICTGIEILNKLLRAMDICVIDNYIDEVVNNILVEVLEDGEETYSIVEQMLVLYNEMIEDNRITTELKEVVQYRGDGLFIRTSEMLNQMRIHIKNTGLNMNILSNDDFKKQAKKAGYLLKLSGKQLKVGQINKKFDIYNAAKLKKLNLDMILPPDFIENEWKPGEERRIMQVNFNKKVT